MSVGWPSASSPEAASDRSVGRILGEFMASWAINAQSLCAPRAGRPSCAQDVRFPPKIAYARGKTGLLLLEEQFEHYSPEAIAEWKVAIDGYLRQEAGGTEQ